MKQLPTIQEFRISADEAHSRLWQRLTQHLQGELVHLREKNDSTTLGIAETTAMRGQIALVKRMLALADEAGPASRADDGDEEVLADADGQFSRL